MLDTINSKMAVGNSRLARQTLSVMSSIPSVEEREHIRKRLRDMPENGSLFKCDRCKTVFDIYSRVLPIFVALSGKE